MPRIITSHEKLAIIDDWLSGESRYDIAIKHNVGNGTVYNIVQEWSKEIGQQGADRLREIAIKLKQNGLTISDCAKGLRMLMLLKKYEIEDDDNEEKVTYFLNELYSKSQEVGLKPQQVFDYIGDILKFSSEISISQIPHYLKKKIEEKEKLEKDIQELYKKRDELTELKEKTEQEIQRLKNNKETMSKTYNSFATAKSELYKYGIGMENMDHFVRCVVGMSNEGYNHFHILAKIADYENLEKDLKNYKTEVNLKKDELAKLTQEVNDQRNNLKFLKIKVDIFDELEMKGFGITELRTLINMLNEIGMEHHQTFDEIRKKYFDDVKNYDEVIGSRKEIDKLKNELKILENQNYEGKRKIHCLSDSNRSYTSISRIRYL